ncbi:MAG: hypothetical protein EU540_02020 [Promethearchaeota archaeon]|nr:MAG: hypothetical protein EU540_02020 [Candidatus Lokiarchaeota archaeon]
MRFCESCGNMLIPKKGKLYCKACDEEFEIGESREEYKIIKKIRHDDKEVAPIIIKEGIKGDRISDQDRKAFEEYFSGGEESGY